MKDLIAELLIWVSVVTGLPPAPPPDDVVFVPHEMLQVGATPGRVRLGGYLCERRIVVLPKGWLPDVEGRSVLAHELTHHLQCVAPDIDASTRESEEQALRVWRLALKRLPPQAWELRRRTGTRHVDGVSSRRSGD